MRKRFEQQLKIGQVPISEIEINPKTTNALEQMIVALKEIYCNEEYNKKIFNLLEEIMGGKATDNGRPGMDLWTLFVLAQVRLCLNCSYDILLHQANNNFLIRCLIGVEQETSFGRITFEYQNIYDNVNLLTDDMLKKINDIIVDFGHSEVFKKKEDTALRLKTDSFVVESNVHFPTDYNLLWDCHRKCLDMVGKLRKHCPASTQGWRKFKSWGRDLKSLMRMVGRASAGGGKNKEARLREHGEKYVEKSKLLLKKLKEFVNDFSTFDEIEFLILCELLHYMNLTEKHIDLFERRVLKGEQIPHEEKIFSVFEPYTEWINKGKLRPNVELGKRTAITTDQWNLIVDYHIMNHEQDRDIVISLSDRLLLKFIIASWSFDKGFWDKTNRDLLRLEIENIVMPKLGKLSRQDRDIEESPMFKRLKNKHSAIESNINELEHRGLDRCPDKGEAHFNRYIGMAVCAYNLKKIGKAILKSRQEAEKSSNKAA